MLKYKLRIRSFWILIIGMLSFTSNCLTMFPFTKKTYSWITTEDFFTSGDFSKIVGINKIGINSNGEICFLFQYAEFNKNSYTCDAFGSTRIKELFGEQIKDKVLINTQEFINKNGIKIDDLENRVFYSFELNENYPQKLNKASFNLSKYLKLNHSLSPIIFWFGRSGYNFKNVYITKDKRYIYFSESDTKFFSMEIILKEDSIRLIPHKISKSISKHVNTIWYDYRLGEIIDIYHPGKEGESRVLEHYLSNKLPLNTLEQIEVSNHDSDLSLYLFPKEINSKTKYLLIHNDKLGAVSGLQHFPEYVVEDDIKLRYTAYPLLIITIGADMIVTPVIGLSYFYLFFHPPRING